jgi:vacuolar-type H+-ATPase subunit I/STV1
MDTYTISEAAKLLAGQVSKAALRKRVQRPEAPGGLRSVKAADGKRRIPRSELERAGFRLDPHSPDAAELVRELVEKIATQEAELSRLRALPARLEAEADAERQAATEAAERAQQAEQQARATREELEAIKAARWWQRRKMLRASGSSL